MRFWEITQCIEFCKTTDRIGPDVPYTHWPLYFGSTMVSLSSTESAGTMRVTVQRCASQIRRRAKRERRGPVLPARAT